MSGDKFETFGSSTLVDNKHSIRIYVNAEDEKAFRELVHRGANLWPDAPPAIKQFADLVTVGQVQQDYHTQATTPNKKS